MEGKCSIPCENVVHSVEFAPYDECHELLAVATSLTIDVYRVKMEPDEEEDDGDFGEGNYPNISLLKTFNVGSQVTTLTWSSESSFGQKQVQDKLKFAVASDNHKICVFNSDLRTEDTVNVLLGHTDFINSMCYCPGNDILASTGDDLTCRLWQQDGEMESVFQLSSPGTSVCIHENDPGKVLVAQKNGVIKIFSLELQLQIMSLDCGCSPLTCADWCRLDDDIVAAAVGNDCMIFQLSRSSQCQEKRQLYTEGTKSLRWAKCSPTLLATCGRPGRQVKVISTRHQQVLLSKEFPVTYDLSWSYIHPMLAVGGDRVVQLYLVDMTKCS